MGCKIAYDGRCEPNTGRLSCVMSEPHYLIDILVLLCSVVVVIPIFQRLGLGSVLGYLVAGALVGPWGLSIIDQVEEIRHISEFGVVFLLFVIGIELKPARLWVMRRAVFGLGSAQVLLTGALLSGLALAFRLDGAIALIVGFGLALSSTAFGLQILTERGELGSATGRVAIAILLLQDLAVVPLLALVSLLARDSALVEGIEVAVLETLVVLAIVVLVGRFLLSPVLRLVATARNSEVFTAAAVLLVLGTAWLMAEVGLSMALGAFLAGLMLAESHYRHQIIADIQPFRGVLLGLFFMAVGMSVDFGLLGERGLLVAALVVGLLAVKAALLWGLCRLWGERRGVAARVALLLSQSGEFGFVLFGFAVASGIMTGELFVLLTLVVALTMATTPLLARLGQHLERRLKGEPEPHPPTAAGKDHHRGQVIVAGFGRVGHRVAKVLEAAQVPYLGLERDPDRVARARAQGFNVFYGDASRADVLKAAGADRARILVLTLDQVEPASRLVHILRAHYPQTPIYARACNLKHRQQLRKAGVTDAISETLEASLQLGGAVLQAWGLPSDEVNHLIEESRRDYYGRG